MTQEDGKVGRFDDGSDRIIAACIEVHRHLGPGLLPNHQAQALTYLKLTGLPVALLVNFNVAVLKHGLRRLTKKPDPTFLSSRLPVP